MYILLIKILNIFAITLAIDDNCRLTKSFGEKIVAFPLPPKLAKILLLSRIEFNESSLFNF